MFPTLRVVLKITWRQDTFNCGRKKHHLKKRTHHLLQFHRTRICSTVWNEHALYRCAHSWHKSWHAGSLFATPWWKVPFCGFIPHRALGLTWEKRFFVSRSYYLEDGTRLPRCCQMDTPWHAMILFTLWKWRWKISLPGWNELCDEVLLCTLTIFICTVFTEHHVGCPSHDFTSRPVSPHFSDRRYNTSIWHCP